MSTSSATDGSELRDSALWQLPERWWRLPSMDADGVTNMAIDGAMLDGARDAQRGIWRCYGWSTPVVSFGRNERIRDRYSPASLESAGLLGVRRPTGGRALLHWREVTYAAAFPLPEQVPWRAAYAQVNALVLQALTALGIPAALADAALADAATAPVRPDGPVCFDQPAAGEIMVAGGKLVGSAVWRERGAYLQHGSILLADDQFRLATAGVTPQPVAPAAASLAQCGFGHLRDADVADALEHALRRQVPRVEDGPEPLALSQIARHRAHFADPDWLWRR